MGSCRDRTASPAEAAMGSCRERTASPAQDEMGSYRYRGLAGYSPNWYRIVTDGGEGGREGGMDLSNRSMPAPCRNTGDRSNRRGSVPSTCLPALSADDDYLGMSDMGQTPTPFEEEEAEEKRPVIVRPGEMKAGNDPEAAFRRSTRVRRQNVRLSDYELNISAALVIQAVNELLEPMSVTEALSAPDAKQWIKALETEYGELMRNHVWELVDRPSGVKILKNKWIFVRKRNAQGDVCRYRTRVTIKGCQQEFGVNFWETYAPVAKAESVKFVLLLALFLGLPCRQIDFVTAFLNGPLDDVDIYMEQPDYFNDGSGRVCQLLQSLYGLRQAPRIWYKMLDEYLRKCGFRRTKMDAGVYVRTVGENKVYITVYVDDLLIVGTESDIEMVLVQLRSKFKIKDLGPVKHLLGMEISYMLGCRMSITQHGYMEKILTRFKMTKCKPVPTPQVQGNFPMPGNPDVEPVCVDPDPDMDYRQIVGSLQYLVQCTRPDIANAVRTLGKFLNCYTREHYVLVKRVLRYLRGSSDYGLLWTLSNKTRVPKDVYVNASRPTIDVQIVAYADADLGNERDDRRSVTGYVLQMEGCTYVYTSHKQRLITDDTCCSEFVAAAECSTMIMWTHNMCKELGVRRKRTILYEDNQAAIKVIEANTGDYK
ncbi:unnamed protein product [Peronospora farinosa]|uniref:Reverse transcriptase Ty1/copia-type domain-containing protein n=1 Tax=Peronospora farinosa TaxID=134698 RepID=A0AAV0U0M0_9STRA|nr:unnamed protein product [Peronospora farinosa]